MSVVVAYAAWTVAHQDHLEGLGGADEAGEALRATEAGDEAEGELRQTDLRANQSNASVAGLMDVSGSCALSRRCTCSNDVKESQTVQLTNDNPHIH